MKVGIMQPYLFPYLGYFQLINAVDKFVIHDDVQYIKGGWINRNSILINNTKFNFTFSVKKEHYYKNINERYYASNFEQESNKLLRNIEIAYKKSPNFHDIYKLIINILKQNIKNVSEFNTMSIIEICNYIGIESDISMSSKLCKNNSLKGEERVIGINKCLKSSWYINPIGGIQLYSKDNFEKNNIKLNFIKMKDIKYKQFNNNFIQSLSIIDVLMFNSKEETKRLLDEYQLI
ncbi:WbqC family protein [Clostridium sp. OS1-26]|uniref:WbqC family protein n=1 Tax=Clostridium sp. OS1-26 TaxID=3070681 RepID=UPI0027E1177E|nr:WbqC family protein [Clostridium sp. OS1-26]WML35818.1 WbqC family protein [Clostridium sp. OS1-26]